MLFKPCEVYKWLVELERWDLIANAFRCFGTAFLIARLIRSKIGRASGAVDVDVIVELVKSVFVLS